MYIEKLVSSFEWALRASHTLTMNFIVIHVKQKLRIKIATTFTLYAILAEQVWMLRRRGGILEKVPRIHRIQ